MTRRLFALAFALVLAGLLSATPAGGASSPSYDRLNLLAADTDYLYWGVDAFDPELGRFSISRTCGVGLYSIPGGSKPCLAATTPTEPSLRLYALTFLPGSLLGENVTWNGSTPLRFHVEGAVNTLGLPFSVHFFLQKSGGIIVESPAATEVSPGVWEGSISGGGPLTSSTVNLMGIRVRTTAPVARIDLDLAGHTYLQLPKAVAARSVPDLIREDTYQPARTTYSSPTRSFTFNDADWSVRSFTGTTGAVRQFDVPTSKRSEIVMAWVEVFDSTFVQDVKHGRQPDPWKMREGAAVDLLRAGESLDPATSGFGSPAIGTEAIGILDLPAGPLTLQVDSASDNEPVSMPFTAYVLEIGGERTLRSMHWKFTTFMSARTPQVGQCPPHNEPVPATDEVRSIALDLDWETEAPGLPSWTLSGAIPGVGDFPCGEMGLGDELRLNVPVEQVWHMGATPAHDSLHVSAFDTTFEMTAEYTYSAPPAA